MTLFISYSRTDTSVIRQIHAALQQRGRETWVDWEGIAPSADWMRAIESAIDEADAVVFAMSPASLESVVCGRELAHAHAQRKRVLPVLVKDAGAVPVPAELARLNWIFLRPEDDFDTGIARLLEAVDTDLAWVQEHTRLLVKAREWQAARTDSSRLLRGRALQQAEAWLALGPTKVPPPTALQTELVLASRRHASRRRSLALAGTGLTLAVLAGVGSVAWVQQRESQRQETLATARRLAAASERLREQPPTADVLTAPAERALQWAAEAVRRLDALGERSLDADLALRRALQQTLEPVRSLEPPFLSGWALATLQIDDQGRLSALQKGPWHVRQWAGDEADWTDQSFGTNSNTDPALSPDGRWTAGLQWDGSMRPPLQLHRVGGEAAALEWKPDQPISGLAVTSDGLAFAATAGGIRLLGPGAALAPAVLPRVRDPLLSPDGRWLAAHDDARVTLWSVAALRAGDATPAKRFEHDGIGQVRFTSDGRGLLFNHGGSDERVTAVALDSLSEAAPLERELPMAAGPEARFWLSLTPDRGLVQVSRGSTGTPLGRLLVRPTGLASFSPDGTLVAVERGRGVDVWRLQPHGSAAFGMQAGADARALALSADGREVVVLRASSVVRWSRATPDRPQAWPLRGKPSRWAFSADGRLLALAEGRAAWVVDTTNGAERLRLQLPAVARDLALSPHGDTLTVLDGAGTLASWTVADHQPAGSVAGAASASGFLAVGDGGAPLTLFHATVQARIGRIHELRRWGSAAEAPASSALGRRNSGLATDPCGLSPDGRLAAIMSTDSVEVRDTASGRSVAIVDEVGRTPLCTLSADGAWLATTGRDATLRVWDLAARQEAARMELQDDAAAIALSADGSQVAVLDREGAVRVWPLRLAELLSQACRRLRHSMSEADWQRFHPGEPYRPTCPGLQPAPPARG